MKLLHSRPACVIAAIVLALLPTHPGQAGQEPLPVPAPAPLPVPLPVPSPPATSPVLAGIDVLRAESFARLAGRRVGLLTNLAARTRDRQLTLDAVRAAPGLRLVALFTPEHGLTAVEEGAVASSRVSSRVSSREAGTGLPVHSLYGETQRPTPAMLQGIDVLLIDLPDVGARFYTYMTTVAYVLEEAAKAGVAVMVLDRPNPVNGVSIDGPSLDAGLSSFVGYFPMPIRHGLTLGELARLFNGERKLGAALTVVAAAGWRREMWFDETGLPWSNPSPNIRNLRAATLYPGIGAIEWSNLSVGRGTDAPFEQIGAPWIDGARLADALNRRRIPGVLFAPVSFTPDSSVYARQLCSGVSITITDRALLRPVRLGIEIASAVRRQHPDRFDFGRTVQLLGSQQAIERIRNGDAPEDVAALWTVDEALWRDERARYLLY